MQEFWRIVDKLNLSQETRDFLQKATTGGCNTEDVMKILCSPDFVKYVQEFDKAYTALEESDKESIKDFLRERSVESKWPKWFAFFL